MPARSIAALALAIVAVACTTGAPPPTATSTPAPAVPSPNATPATSITVYSGRSEELVGPLLGQFTGATRITVNARYGDTAELAALLLEEGENTPADVYFAQDAGALGAVAKEGMLAELPDEVLSLVPESFRSPAGQWVGVSGRARVVVYDSRDVSEEDLPDSILGFTDPEWRGRIGWTPTNGSFQAFVTAFRLLRGDDAARQWLEGIVANEPRRYSGNSPIVQAVADGEIDVGFVNHYYLLRAIEEQGPMFPVRNHYLAGNDPGALVNVAGVGILHASQKQDAARRFVEFLLSREAQEYFANETFEFPLLAGVAPPTGAPPLAEVSGPPIDLSNLDDLAGTLRMLNETGVLP
ncbi:MAG: iron ABC transporter substrate-binding protein [Chloroflexota bacterium]|nr:iron ABC transporter substrate-binding protein [Chloroflexota bacterium]